MTTPRLELTGVAAGYDGAAVIRAIDVELFPGEVVALLGPNGAGKTTILRVISGLVRPMRGTVRAVGMDVARTSPQRLVHRGVSHVAEGRSVFFGLTVAEHFRLRYRGLKSDPDEVMKYFPVLVELRNRRVGLLSGGEQQMLALACALARQPKLLLVDELSLGLAPKVVEQLLPVIRRYATDMGRASCSSSSMSTWLWKSPIGRSRSAMATSCSSAQPPNYATTIASWSPATWEGRAARLRRPGRAAPRAESSAPRPRPRSFAVPKRKRSGLTSTALASSFSSHSLNSILGIANDLDPQLLPLRRRTLRGLVQRRRIAEWAPYRRRRVSETRARSRRPNGYPVEPRRKAPAVNSRDPRASDCQ